MYTSLNQPSSLLAGATTGVVLLAIIFTLYGVGLCVYRRYFHPLSAFPGPWLNAVSPLPGISALVRGRLAFEMKQIHDKYGPVVRIGPNELTFNTAKAWKDIYGNRQGHANFPKDPVHAGAVQPVGSKGTVTLQYERSDASHARQKRVLAHAFSMKALVEQEDIVALHVRKLVDNLQRFGREGKTFDLCMWFAFVTFDLTGDLAFKESFGCLDSGEYSFWVTLLFLAIQGGAYTQATRRFATAGSWLQKKLLTTFVDVREPNRKHMELSRLKVLKRLSNENDEHRDFIWYLLKNKERFDITQEEIIANSSLFIMAGAETTASALAGLMARLFYNPHVYDKLVQEIRSTFQSADEINHDKILQMPYVNAVVWEGLRIHPPVPGGNMRMVPKGGDTVDGIAIPEGTTVSVGSWSASHNPNNFRHPDDFIPERWIGDEYASDVKDAMQPFSLGPRNCLGKNLALLELRITLVHVLYHLDIRSADGAPAWDPSGDVQNLRSFMVWDKPPLMAKAYPAAGKA